MARPTTSETAIRRAPFSDNPAVGTRGRRTQQRILDAALAVFAEHGYERTTLDKIGQVAGCSRVSIYQYFAGKEDLFRHLAGQVARRLRESFDELDPLSAGAEGRAALHAWVERYADVHARYEGVFRAFGTAARSDEAVAGGSARAAQRNLAAFESKVAAAGLPAKRVGPLLALLHSTVTRSLDIGAILGAAQPDAQPLARRTDAIADVVHRALFGRVDGVNAGPPPARPMPALRLGPDLAGAFERARALQEEAARSDRRALSSLIAVGRDVIVARGYQGTRVDDVVEAAGVSHGAFYRYFRNMDDFVRVIAMVALAEVSSVLGELPTDPTAAALRRWLRRYNAVHAETGAVIRVWTEGAQDPLWSDRAAVYDWGRRRCARLLRSRDFGDHDGEAVVLLALIDAFGSVPRSAAELDAALHVVERGFLGR